MTPSKILQKDAPVLREVAQAVSIKDIKSKKIGSVINKMKKALHGEVDGVGIAAPQIGESLRIFIVSASALAWVNKTKKGSENQEFQDMIFINPEIIKLSKKKNELEEGCLSVRYLYGQVERSEKVTIRAYGENGEKFERGGSGLMAQIFQHEVDHLNGILFIDKAENVRDIPPQKQIKFVFFGSLPAQAGSQFSKYVLDELRASGLSPMLEISSTKTPLSIKELKKLDAEVFVVASFGKILPKELIELPQFKTLNVHPSLLPKLRGPAPIQGAILSLEEPGVSIMRLDEKMDHGPLLAQEPVPLAKWPDHYEVVEEKLGRAGGKLLGKVLPQWLAGEIEERPQEDNQATYTKLIRKEDGLIDFNDLAEENLKKVLAYSTWPGAYTFYKNKRGKEIRIVIKDATIQDGTFTPVLVIPAGKREMSWQAFLRGNA